MLKTEQEDNNTLFFSIKPLISNRPRSSKVYTNYGSVSAGVPFLWESKPGTPIHTHSSAHHNTTSFSYPPLNPPPCYNKKNHPPMKRRSKSFSLRSILPVFISGKRTRRCVLAPESLSPSSSSSASSVPSSPVFKPLAIFRRSQSSTITKSGFDYDFYDDDSVVYGRSTARCFWL